MLGASSGHTLKPMLCPAPSLCPYLTGHGITCAPDDDEDKEVREEEREEEQPGGDTGESRCPQPQVHWVDQLGGHSALNNCSVVRLSHPSCSGSSALVHVDCEPTPQASLGAPLQSPTWYQEAEQAAPRSRARPSRQQWSSSALPHLLALPVSVTHKPVTTCALYASCIAPPASLQIVMEQSYLRPAFSFTGTRSGRVTRQAVKAAAAMGFGQVMAELHGSSASMTTGSGQVTKEDGPGAEDRGEFGCC